MSFVKSLVTGSPANYDPGQEWGAEELQSQLMQQSRGEGPNLAGAQMQAATDQNIAKLGGFLGQQKGISTGTMNRQAGLLAGQLGTQATQDAGRMRMLQQLESQRQLQALIQGNQAIRAGQAQANANFQAGVLGGGMQGAGSYLGLSAMGGGGEKKWSGGEITGMAAGGPVPGGPSSALGQMMLNMTAGGPVPGRAMVAGDSPTNDTVPAMLSPGEVVLPRTIAQAPNAPDKAAQFVASLMARKRGA